MTDKEAREFLKALEIVADEKGISKEVIFEAMELALATAYKKNNNAQENVKVVVDRESGLIKVFSFVTVVDEITDDKTEILLKEAKKQIPNIEIGETIDTEITPKDFGRVAIGTAKQVVMQKIREAERNSIMEQYHDKEGELVVGTLSMEDANSYYVDLGRTRGVLSKKEIIPGEKLIMGKQVKVYVSKVEETTKGPLILLTRKHFGFVKRLLELEIPELNDGTISLFGVARDPGVRSKIAVYSDNERIDAVGACIGEGGNRIGRILKELNGEKVDIVKYDKDPTIFIANALSPAQNVRVIITDPKKQLSIAIVDENNLQLAIGKKGQNVKLASTLTRYRIDVKTSAQLKEVGINLSFEE